MRQATALMAPLALTLALLAGCVSDDGGQGSASIYVKDAPTDEFAEIHVVFTMVEVHVAGGDDEDDETDDGDSGWTTVFENATGADVDLLNASGSQAAFLGEANLTAGRYTQIRIHATEAYGVDSDGNRTDFSFANNVLKLAKSFSIEEGKESRIILDFDLDRSLVKTGGPSGGWKMTPVIGTTTVETVEDDESGADVHDEGEIVEVA